MPKSEPSGHVLDTSSSSVTYYPDSFTLAEILTLLGLPVAMKSFDVIAQDLSRLAGKRPPWTKKYVHSVYMGRIAPSPKFSKAIEKLAQVTDGTPRGVAGSVYVRVLAQPTIPEGVLIPASATVIKCARPGCPVWFIKVNPNQKYHDPDCSPYRGHK